MRGALRRRVKSPSAQSTASVLPCLVSRVIGSVSVCLSSWSWCFVHPFFLVSSGLLLVSCARGSAMGSLVVYLVSLMSSYFQPFGTAISVQDYGYIVEGEDNPLAAVCEAKGMGLDWCTCPRQQR